MSTVNFFDEFENKGGRGYGRKNKGCVGYAYYVNKRKNGKKTNQARLTISGDIAQIANMELSDCVQPIYDDETTKVEIVAAHRGFPLEGGPNYKNGGSLHFTFTPYGNVNLPPCPKTKYYYNIKVEQGKITFKLGTRTNLFDGSKLMP